ncbi:hypothetical protein HanHA300_Chr11g0420411 [Helianthus annuus]|nr:hypothetical protein HanHA300_Chr11g0420411 [Helianthus annuus]KAJ0876908.1 hypothetical protein HanPSC8_Chr11g0493861 [Helianthus annuus]
MGGDAGRGGGSFQVRSDVQEEERSVVVPDKMAAFEELRGLGVVGRIVDLETLVDFDKLLRIAKVWEPLFSKLDAWEGQALPLERVVWLKISGVPLHLFDPEVLEMVGGFGKVLHVQKSLLKEKDMPVTRVAVLAGEAMRIREMIKVFWKDRVFGSG